jgi:hypothetical protein
MTVAGSQFWRDLVVFSFLPRPAAKATRLAAAPMPRVRMAMRERRTCQFSLATTPALTPLGTRWQVRQVPAAVLVAPLALRGLAAAPVRVGAAAREPRAVLAVARALLALVAPLALRGLAAAPVRVGAAAREPRAVLAVARALLAVVAPLVLRGPAAALVKAGAAAGEAQAVPAAALVPAPPAVPRVLAVRAASGARSATPAPGIPRSRPRRRSIPTARP